MQTTGRTVDRRLLLAAVALALGLVALGSWVAVDRLAGESRAGAAALIEDVTAAWNAGPGAAAAAFYAEDAVVALDGDVYLGRREIASLVDDARAIEFRVVPVGHVAVYGDYAASLVAWSNGRGESGTDVVVFQLENGAITGHWAFDTALWPPPEFEGS